MVGIEVREIDVREAECNSEVMVVGTKEAKLSEVGRLLVPF